MYHKAKVAIECEGQHLILKALSFSNYFEKAVNYYLLLCSTGPHRKMLCNACKKLDPACVNAMGARVGGG